MEIIDWWSLPGIKIALFRSLFRRRDDDVYPRRFESLKNREFRICSCMR
jgi:hypothetical protein